MAAGGDGGGAAEWSSAVTGGATLTEFFRMVSAGLAADAPRMRASTLLALAKLVSAFADSGAVASLLPELTQSLLPLLGER